MRRRRIEKIPSAVATISRRIEYLDQRLEEHVGNPRHRDFDRREVGALRTSIDAMNLAQLFQRAESDPIALLEELVEAADLLRQCQDKPGTQAFVLAQYLDRDVEELIDAADRFRELRPDADEQERAEALGSLLEVRARAQSTVALADAYLDPGEAG